MPKLTETYVSKLPTAKAGTQKYWDTEVRGLSLFVGACEDMVFPEGRRGQDAASADRPLPGHQRGSSTADRTRLRPRMGQGRRQVRSDRSADTGSSDGGVPCTPEAEVGDPQTGYSPAVRPAPEAVDEFAAK